MKDFASSALKMKDLDLMNDKKKALPDMIQKRDIFIHQNNMNSSFGVLMSHVRRNNGHIEANKVIDVISNIIECFQPVKDMIQDNGCLTLDPMQRRLYSQINPDKTDFEVCLELCIFPQVYTNQFTVKDLNKVSLMVSYMNYALKSIGVTDLLMTPEYDDIPISDIS